MDKQFNLGDRVAIINPGSVYDTYKTMAKRLLLKNWYEHHRPLEGIQGTVIAKGDHDYSGELVYAIRFNDGTEVLMAPKGIELASHTSRRVSNEKWNKQRRENYRSNKRLLARVNRIWPDKGIALVDQEGRVYQISKEGIGLLDNQRRQVIYRHPGAGFEIIEFTDSFLHNNLFKAVRWNSNSNLK